MLNVCDGLSLWSLLLSNVVSGRARSCQCDASFRFKFQCHSLASTCTRPEQERDMAAGAGCRRLAACQMVNCCYADSQRRLCIRTSTLAQRIGFAELAEIPVLSVNAAHVASCAHASQRVESLCLSGDDCRWTGELPEPDTASDYSRWSQAKSP